jgi:hypothetical protein
MWVPILQVLGTKQLVCYPLYQDHETARSSSIGTHSWKPVKHKRHSCNGESCMQFNVEPLQALVMQNPVRLYFNLW